MELNNDNIHRLIERGEKISTSFCLEQRKAELAELETRSFDPHLWDNAEVATRLTSELSRLKDKIQAFTQSESALDMLRLYVMDPELCTLEDLRKYFEYAEAYCDEYELSQQFSEECDRMPALIKITAGAGGTEAQDWAGMVFNMYNLWAKGNGYTVDVENYDDDCIAGIKTGTLKIEGPDFPYGLLKGETGIHRLVRVSPFNAQGKRMTSFCAVTVTPLIDDTFEVNVPESEMTFEYFRSGGAGGQNVNKVNSGCRARYVWTNSETGEKEEIIVANTETRDQPKNKENAIRILRSRVYQKELEIKRRKEQAIEDSKADNGWGNQARSYVLDDSRVKDHRTDHVDHNPTAVLAGHIDGFLQANLLN